MLKGAHLRRAPPSQVLPGLTQVAEPEFARVEARA